MKKLVNNSKRVDLGKQIFKKRKEKYEKSIQKVLKINMIRQKKSIKIKKERKVKLFFEL